MLGCKLIRSGNLQVPTKVIAVGNNHNVSTVLGIELHLSIGNTPFDMSRGWDGQNTMIALKFGQIEDDTTELLISLTKSHLNGIVGTAPPQVSVAVRGSDT